MTLGRLIASTTRASFYEALREQGYVYLPGVLDRDKIIDLRDRVLTVLRAERWVDAHGRPVSPAHRIGSPEFIQCIEALMQIEVLHDLSHDPIIVGVMSELIGSGVLVHPRKMVRLNYPNRMNPHDSVPAHQDLFYVKGERDTFTAWIPLVDCPPGHGGLDVLRRSHLAGLLPVNANEEGRFNCSAADVDFRDPLWESANYRAGDMLVFHALTVHRSAANECDSFRLSLDCRYSAACGVINADQLLPPYHPHVRGWGYIARSFTRPDRVVPAPSAVLQDASASPSEALARTSRYCP